MPVTYITKKRVVTKSRKTKKNTKALKRRMRKYNKSSSYRSLGVRSLNFPNLRPAKQVVKFAARERFLVSGVASANTKSILQIPLTYLGSPSVISGAWTGDSGTFHVPQYYNEYFPKYKYYKVLGVRLQVTVRPSGIGEEGANQFQNLVFLATSADSNQYNGATALEDLEEGRDINQAAWHYSGPGGGFRPCSISRNYSAKKTHGIKDIEDYSALRAVTTFNTAAGENTFMNVIICASLDQASTGHAGAIVDIQGSYIVMLTEPTPVNIPN